MSDVKVRANYIVAARNEYIAAPAGFARRADGTIYKDGTDPKKSSPEMSICHAYWFSTESEAKRQAAKIGDHAIVRKISVESSNGLSISFRSTRPLHDR